MEHFINFALKEKNIDKIMEFSFSSKLLIRLINYKKHEEIEEFLRFYLDTPEIHNNVKWFKEDVEKLESLFPHLNISSLHSEKNTARRKLRIGKLIVIEGNDGVGKTTQIELLKESLTNEKVVVISFPVKTTHIGKILNNPELPPQTLHLLYSANRWEMNDKIQELLYKGYYVILERYTPSGVAHSMARGLDKDWCCKSEDSLIRPDVIIFLKSSEDNHSDYFKRVENAFETLITTQWHVIPRKSIKETHDAILSVIS